MQGNYRRAWMIVMVFLVTMLSPLTVDNEPVEAHWDDRDGDPPLLVEVYIEFLYSTEDLDDGGFLYLGGDAELAFLSDVEHVGHGGAMAAIQLDWNMDQDDGTGIWWWNTDNRVEITRDPCWYNIPNVVQDTDCDRINDDEDEDDDGDGIDDVDDEYPRDPDNNGVEGLQEQMWWLDMQHTRIWTHTECTPRTDVTYSFEIGAIPSLDWQWLTLTGAAVAGLTVTILSAGTAAILATAVAGTASIVGVGAQMASAWEVYHDEIEEFEPANSVEDYELQPGTNIIFPSLNGNAGQGGPIGVNISLEVTELDRLDHLDHAHCTPVNNDSEDSEQVDDSNEEEEVDYQAARESVSDGFGLLRSAYAMINESTSLANSTDLIGSDGCDQVNGTGDCDDWNKTQYPNDPLNETDPYNSTTHTVDRGITLMRLNGIVGNITSEYLTIATTANPDVAYPLNMDLWYANFLTQGGHYFDALEYYESAILGSIDAIENAPPPPPATVTIQAEGDDIPEDLFIEIYSGDCGDDCAEEDLVFVGEEGDSEIETSLESGEYTVVMIADGDVYSSDYLEVQSGGDITVLKVSDGVGGVSVLNLAFYIQGLIVAALPAVVGFAGSRRYLENDSDFSTNEATPLWIGVAIFIAVFYLMTG